ncbi:hypothetical protein BU26DRAFT_90911 [Trematosphaeria pertusa]|uniref:Uncharacterized protein n=1 Tax=Trematosphaeria pertusa TaxID=390896 RepID=A0A6A6I610_9PLEO|nr:uncharacterized protein BU26DRAFT_90911 [Trematosphaeria pertusa]KAF2245013.1 hypothetical protein BU26DRAFT_90911 [Trematosphaeria pertusa]
MYPCFAPSSDLKARYRTTPLRRLQYPNPRLLLPLGYRFRVLQDFIFFLPTLLFPLLLLLQRLPPRDLRTIQLRNKRRPLPNLDRPFLRRQLDHILPRIHLPHIISLPILLIPTGSSPSISPFTLFKISSSGVSPLISGSPCALRFWPHFLRRRRMQMKATAKRMMTTPATPTPTPMVVVIVRPRCGFSVGDGEGVGVAGVGVDDDVVVVVSVVRVAIAAIRVDCNGRGCGLAQMALHRAMESEWRRAKRTSCEIERRLGGREREPVPRSLLRRFMAAGVFVGIFGLGRARDRARDPSEWLQDAGRR